MKAFENYNPMIITVYFLCVTCILMFSQNPILLLFGFVGAVSYFLAKNGLTQGRSHLFYLLLFLVLTIINPLVSHNGKTVLFVMSDAPITLEATVYGAVSAGVIVSVLYLFRIFTEMMTRDKLLYVFGKLSPKLALILSMGLRYVPLFKERAKKISESQRALGLYKEDNILDKTKSDLRVFSILITWALENGITTADSMSARGYGRGKRTYYTLFQFRSADAAVLAVTLICAAVTTIGMGTGALAFQCYPSIALANVTPLAVASYTAYGILALLPMMMEMEEKLKWRYLQSKI